MKKSGLFFLLLLAPFFACGQNTMSVVRGTLTDRETKEPLVFAMLHITLPGGERVGALTDIEGMYKFSLRQTGKCILTVTYLGYYSESVPLIVDSGKISTCNIMLCPDGTVLELLVPVSEPPTPGTPKVPEPKSRHAGNRLLFPPTHDSAWNGIDSFALSGIRRAGHDQLATSLFRSGKLYRFNDTTWYFHKGSCPGYAIYYQRGNRLYAAAPFYEKRLRAEKRLGHARTDEAAVEKRFPITNYR
jgi:hypothetical protein